MTDVLGNHCLAQAVAANQYQVAGFREEIQRESALDNVTFDLSGPSPIEVGDGLETLNPREAQTALKASPGAFGHLCLNHLLQYLVRRPASFGGVR